MIKNDIKHNIKAHDQIAKTYDLKHSEIYNFVEQERIDKVVQRVIKLSKNKKPKILDFGAGTGNLTYHFLKNGCNVMACDISQKSLEVLKIKFKKYSNFDSLLIDGNNLLIFEDNYFDVVATYSVLHHIPDYISTIKELIRVTKKDGVIYIDHESNKNKWKPNKYLKDYYLLTKKTKLEHFKQLVKTKELFTTGFIKTLFINLFIDRRYQREGDIHIWPEDHIEWNKIENIIRKNNCIIIEKVDYLMYKTKGGIDLYNKYKNKCNDTKYMIIKKI